MHTSRITICVIKTDNIYYVLWKYINLSGLIWKHYNEYFSQFFFFSSSLLLSNIIGKNGEVSARVQGISIMTDFRSDFCDILCKS